MSHSPWAHLEPELARTLVDARLQLHHAAQLASAFAISYVTPEADDSHTSLEWLGASCALASTSSLDVRIALSVPSLTLELTGGSLRLGGRTIAEAAGWVRDRLSRAGLDAARYTLERHYEIPTHPVAAGAPFEASEEHLEQLSRWLANGALLLEGLRAEDARASDVRCWPHHFDIATLISVRPGHTVGIGLAPGDDYYAEPYFYVNAYPRPSPADVDGVPLGGAGTWHIDEWVGAVLPGSRLTRDRSGQESQAAEFIDSAVRAATALLG